VKHPKYSWSSVLDTPEREGKEADGRRQEDDVTGIRGLHFSHRGRYMAVAQREGCKDYIAIYDCVKQWMLAKVPPTRGESLTQQYTLPTPLFLFTLCRGLLWRRRTWATLRGRPTTGPSACGRHRTCQYELLSMFDWRPVTTGGLTTSLTLFRVVQGYVLPPLR
jgi:hypothetical protein